MTINPLDILAYLGLGLGITVFLVHIIALWRAKTYLFSYKMNQNDTINKIGVSIIKTIVSYSPKMFQNLESVFCLNYTKFELMICVQDENSNAITYIYDLMKKYPHVDAHIYIGAKNIGVNPKINNMLQCYEDIKYDFVWICDSNIRVGEDLLDEMVSHLSPNVGMVHQLPFVINSSKGYGATLEKVYFGTHHARWYLFFNTIGLLCVNGMSSIFNKRLLDANGGLKALAKYIAEDHFMAKTLYDCGHKVVLSTEPSYQNPDTMTFKSFVNRMTRWQILRLTMLPVGFFEPFIESLFLGLLVAYSLYHFYALSFLMGYLFHITMWFISDQLLLRAIGRQKLPPIAEQVVCWLFRETMTYWIWLKAVCNRKIDWHQGTFDISFGGNSKFIPKR